jgi:riboflavin kinase/FMN adenylyltransferase
MKVIYIDDSTVIETETATSIGFFDGVHRGHRHLIEQLKNRAKAFDLPTSVITFSVHPRKILQKTSNTQLLNSLEERIQQLASTQLDYCYVINFTEDFARITAEDFIKKKLHKQLKIKLLLVGYDHKFGQGRSGEFNQYFEYGKACGIEVEKADQLQDKNHPVSSTAIRHFLQEGRIKESAEMLSYSYTLDGIVVCGNKLGRTIGFPTANLELTEKDKVVPKEGIYAARVIVDNQRYSGMVYIGRRPTVLSQGEKRIEVHIFDFDETIYGKKIQIEFIDFLRHDIAFNGVEELRNQLKKDKENAIENFSVL